MPQSTRSQNLLVLSRERPRTKEQLHKYVKQVFGFHIPRRAVCPEHQAPFEVLVELFFEMERRLLVLANRGGGKTRLLSIAHFLKSRFKDRNWIVHVGAIELQAKRCYDYVREYAMDNEYLSPAVVSTLMSITRFTNQSRIEVLPGTLNSLSGPHPPIACADEVEWWPWINLQQFIGMPMSTPEILAQTIYASTRQKVFGTMQRLLDDASKMRLTTHAWCIFETLKPPCPYSSPECPMWRDCEGRRFFRVNYAI